ncbi:hypothetical protein [Colwellia piezophila]|uniref:hypothetical protein n=1 Tax=Colwellia piezophila TaxID=211668 RepID=UPI00036A7CFF|nr:hypothetical protein [Colwellia piezophila]
MMKKTKIFTKPAARSNTLKIKARIALFSSTMLLAFSAYSAQGTEKYDNLQKQLSIMNDIMMSSAKGPQNSDRTLIRSIDSVYLQGQGAIFTIQSAHGGSSHHQFFQMVSSVPSVRSVRGIEQIVISNDEDFVIAFEDHEDEFAHVIEVFEQQREGARELHSEQRDIAYEMRDIARQEKDIHYQLKRAEKSDKADLNTELKKLEKERVTLKADKVQLDKKTTKLNKQLKQQKVAQTKARTAHFSALNNTLVETLCLYGNGLQAIPSKEHVSLIIKGAGTKQSRGYKDQILVFNKTDINACANNKLTVKKLLAKADKYQF